MANVAEPILEVRDITKQFPGVLALNNVSARFLPGEVHAVVGENGAGKSTLMKILAGAYIPDQGEIIFQGQSRTFHHPREAQEAGISIIYQEFNLLPERTVAQNIFLGREPTRNGLIDRRQLRRKTLDVLKQVGAEGMISPDIEVKSLSIAEQQLVEIAKALSFDSKVLIMDEPTAALATHEVEILTRLMQKLIAQGMAIIFISHRFTEVFDLANTITILKDGQLVATAPISEVTPSKVITLMVGRELDQYFPGLAKPEEIGEVMLRISHGNNAKLHDINLELRAGEIVGVAGLQGSGRTELAQAMFGMAPFTSGVLSIKGKDIRVKSPNIAINARMGFVTEDRKAEGIFPNQPLNDNILVSLRALQSTLRRIKRNGTADRPQLVPELVEQVDVRTPSITQEVQYLSGGNQQKVVLAKWLASTCDIFLFDEPTRGIDVDAKASIHEMIRELAQAGAAVLMISSELPEIIGMSDRIVVMWDGRISGELPSGSGEKEIMFLATGHRDEEGEPAAAAKSAETAV
ncbi:MAG: sugar ABC transporter ATP-binding protein [Chloroflexi bacterium]|nr:sugar ABC transporter ATP-binding protein [Chloroflexota bacterium]MBK7179949.1 sugar ABC transporter ATP-binding protein [Chloroflexota bacterium]MBK8935282.1 sugar ABC transporter ATP-binding protein [Chloroflexota bacterium]MBP6803821.1 sugar ABC transporter ATP-binding protein [Chloroflexota bacterium]MBP7592424.1 sugar ABC transporter ATP-binding protein [Chloroflexota bacterium]